MLRQKSSNGCHRSIGSHVCTFVHIRTDCRTIALEMNQHASSALEVITVLCPVSSRRGRFVTSLCTAIQETTISIESSQLASSVATASPSVLSGHRAEVVDLRSLALDASQMQPQNIPNERTVVESCLSCLTCLVCWSCWKDVFWALVGSGSDGFGRYVPPGSDIPVAQAAPQMHPRIEEQQHLLESPGKYPLGEFSRLEEHEDPKTLLYKAGVPRFPDIHKQVPRCLDPTSKKGSFQDLGEFCPTCLDPYTPENPKIVTKCGHHFHLGCIFSWLERSNTCPVCSRPMSFEEFE